MSETIVVAVIVSLASPVLLEIFRTVINKRNKAEEETRTKIAVLEKLVTDLQAANTKQLIEIGILQAENKALKEQIQDKDSRIHELELQVNVLNNKRGSKR